MNMCASEISPRYRLRSTEGDNPNTTQTTNYTYDRYGNTTGVTLTAGGNLKITSSAVYSDYGNYLTESINELGKTTTYNYDSVTKLLKYIQNANNVHTAYTYDNRDRTTKVYLDADKDGIADTAEAQVAYLYANNRLSGIDTATTDYTLTYDTFGNVLTIKAGNYTLATYEYAANNGKLLKLIYGNGDYEQYVYDSLERLVEVKFNGTTEYIVKYDNNGRLYSLTENGATHICEYDSLDRLVRAWQEDTNGNYIVAVENSYDDLGRAKGSTYVVGDRTMAYEINYRPNSNLVNYISMPVAGVQSNIGYTYDEFERVTRKQHSFSNAINFCEEYQYYSYTDAEGAQHTTSLVSSLKLSGNTPYTPTTVYTYTYNNLGNITQIRKDGVIINEYTYDSLGQLVCEEDAVAGVTYIYYYDKAGNITQKDSYPFADGAIMGDYISYLASQKQTVATYTYGNTSWGDLLTAYDGAAITYDAIGNPTKWRNISAMTWEGRELQSATVTAGPRVTYEYNSSGIRTKKTLGSAIEYKYTLDGTKILSETATQLLSGSSYTLYYLYDASGSVQGFIYNNQYYYFQKNLQGDVIRILNSNGAVVTEYTYDAWGNVLTTTGSLASTVGRYNPFRYRSYYYDEETGFYYLQSRYYDPTVGRFLNADGIIGANGGIEGYNMFAYCNNNPIIFADYNGFLRSYSVIVNDGGSSSRNNSEEKSEDEYTKTYTFYRKTKSIDIGSHTVEFEYTYQVDDTKIISAKIESYKLTETPSLFYSQIVDGDVRIVDDFGRRENGSLEFTFIIEDTLFIALPFKYLDMFSIDVHTHPFTFSTYISHDWSSEDDSQ